MEEPATEDVMDELLDAAEEATDKLNQQTSPSCTKKTAKDTEDLPSTLEEERSPLGDLDGIQIVSLDTCGFDCEWMACR